MENNELEKTILRLEKEIQDIKIKLNSLENCLNVYKNKVIKPRIESKDILSMPFDDLLLMNDINGTHIRYRIIAILKRNGFTNFEQVIKYDNAHFLKLPNFGRKSLREMIDFLEDNGITTPKLRY